MSAIFKILSSSTFALAVMGSAHAETRDPVTARVLACPAVEQHAGYREPGPLVRELYRIVSGPAGKPKDWTRLRSLHAPGAIITVPQHVGDTVAAATYSINDFIKLNERLFGERGFFEAELRQEVQQFGHVAHVWSAYSTSEQESAAPSAYGINSFQLLNDGKYWCVLSASWDGAVERHASIREWAGISASSGR